LSGFTWCVCVICCWIQSIHSPVHQTGQISLSSKSSDRKCFVNIRDIIKRYFLKKTHTIIVSFYEYSVYIMFWIMMLYDCYYYYFHFLSKYHCFLQCKIRFFLKVIRNLASKSLRSIEISLYLAFMNEWNVAKQEQILMNDLFYWEILFCWWKVN
jgi:hypothetical protein